MKNLEVLLKQLEDAIQERKPLLDQINKNFYNKCLGDIELTKQVNKLSARIYNLHININQQKQKLFKLNIN